jgi:hypothetical protein
VDVLASDVELVVQPELELDLESSLDVLAVVVEEDVPEVDAVPPALLVLVLAVPVSELLVVVAVLVLPAVAVEAWAWWWSLAA